jgi:ArsR family transcriptional regulator
VTALRTPFRPGFGEAEADELAALLKALASPARLRILALLRSGPMTGAELTTILPQSQPTVAHHLGILAEAGLIDSRKESTYVMRSLATARLREVSRLLDPGWSL